MGIKSYSVTIQMVATEQFFSAAVPFIMLFIMPFITLTFESLDETRVIIQIKAIQQYFSVVLFMLYKGLTCEPCDSNFIMWLSLFCLWMKS